MSAAILAVACASGLLGPVWYVRCLSRAPFMIPSRDVHALLLWLCALSHQRLDGWSKLGSFAAHWCTSSAARQGTDAQQVHMLALSGAGDVIHVCVMRRRLAGVQGFVSSLTALSGHSRCWCSLAWCSQACCAPHIAGAGFGRRRCCCYFKSRMLVQRLTKAGILLNLVLCGAVLHALLLARCTCIQPACGCRIDWSQLSTCTWQGRG
jgi:hypothetical protein